MRISSANSTPPLQVLAALCLVPFVMVLGNSMIIPVLPDLARIYGFSSFQTSLLITLFCIPAALIVPFAGMLSDRFGRKRVIIPSLVLYAAGGLVAAYAAMATEPYAWLAIGRILQGIGAAGTGSIAMALAADLYPPAQRSRALGILESANAFGKVISPLFGALLGLLAWYALFLVFPVLVLPAIWAIAVWVSETPSTSFRTFAAYRADISRTVRRQFRWFMLSSLAVGTIMFFLFGSLVYMSNLLESAGIKQGLARGLYLAAPLLSLTVAAAWAGDFIEKKVHVIRPLLIISLVCTALVCGSLTFAASPFAMSVLLAAGGMGSGLSLSCLNVLVASAVSRAERGIVTSLYGSARFFGIAAGPAAFGAAYRLADYLFGGLFFAFALLAGAALLIVHRPGRVRSKSGYTRTVLQPFPSGDQNK